MDSIINPVLLYLSLAAGAIGVAMALPRPRISPQVIGALVAAIAVGLIFLGLGLKAYDTAEGLPDLFFYVFAIIGLGSALRVISHPKPVYAALYFILTILASSALYLLMQAEFMAFALIIIYAGAILITYLFVIMLATQAPTEGQVEALTDYDISAREPVIATAMGFVLLAVLGSMLAGGVKDLRPAPSDRTIPLARYPGEMERRFEALGLQFVADGEAHGASVVVRDVRQLRSLVRADDPRLEELFDDPMQDRIRRSIAAGDEIRLDVPGEPGPSTEDAARAFLDELARVGLLEGLRRPGTRAVARAMGDGSLQVRVVDPLGLQEALLKSGGSGGQADEERSAGGSSINDFLPDDVRRAIGASVVDGEVVPVRLPEGIAVAEIPNIKHVGWALVAEHPMALELAGVILLMAMLGAVVLARKQIEISEAEKARAVRTLGEEMV